MSSIEKKYSLDEVEHYCKAWVKVETEVLQVNIKELESQLNKLHNELAHAKG